MDGRRRRIVATVAAGMLGTWLGAAVATAADTPSPLYACHVDMSEGKPGGSLTVVANPADCKDRVAVALARQAAVDVLSGRVSTLEEQVSQHEAAIAALQDQVAGNIVHLQQVSEDTEELQYATEVQATAIFDLDEETDELQYATEVQATAIFDLDEENDELTARLDELEKKCQATLARANQAAAQDTADDAMRAAQLANAKASQALSDADDAMRAAQVALARANGAQSSADDAMQAAQVANARASQALTDADDAMRAAQLALARANGAHQRIDEHHGS